MTPTRTAKLSIGPFEAPVGPVSAALISRFVGEAELQGWIAIVGKTDDGIMVSAVRVEPARTVRNRVTRAEETADV